MIKKLLKSLSLAASLVFAFNSNAQVVLTKTLPPFGTTFDVFLHLNPVTLATPDTGIGVTWDYDAATTGLMFSKATSGVVKRLTDVTTPDKDSFPSAVYVEETMGGVAPYQTTARLYYKDEDSFLIRLGQYMKTGTNPENIIKMVDTVIRFNVPFQSGFSSNNLVQKYVGSGTLKIRGNTHNNVAMFKVDGYEQYFFYTNEPFSSRIAHLVLNGDGTGKFLNYYHMAATTGIDETLTDNTILLYPNPAGEMLTTGNLPIGSMVNITDITGKVVYNAVIESEQTTINTAAFVNGVYILHVNSNGNIATKRLIVSK